MNLTQQRIINLLSGGVMKYKQIKNALSDVPILTLDASLKGLVNSGKVDYHGIMGYCLDGLEIHKEPEQEDLF